MTSRVFFIGLMVFACTFMQAQTLKNGEVLISDGMELIYVEGYAEDSGVLGGGIKGFHIGKFEVTQAQWMAVMGSNPSKSSRGDNYPVDNVSWNDVQAFILKLNELTRKNYRLPSEIEWGYAAIGGNISQGYEFAGSHVIDDVAWFRTNSGNATKPVGQKNPNELGIYDMSGNVSEWCQDLFDNNRGANRVYRGGSWRDIASLCRVAGRRSINPNTRNNAIGFRLVLQ